MGPPAYDVASLLQDARVDVPEMMEIALLSRYTRARRAADRGFDAPRFRAPMRRCGAARLQDPRHFRPARSARPQAAISASPAAGMGLFAALAGASGAGAAAAWYRANVPALKADDGCTAMKSSARAPWCSPPASARACVR